MAGLWLLVAALHEWLAWRLDRISAHLITGGGLLALTGLALLLVVMRKPRGSRAPAPQVSPAKAAEQVADQAVDTARETGETAAALAKDALRNKPMTTLGVALGAGLVLGQPTLRRLASHVGAAVLSRMIKP